MQLNLVTGFVVLISIGALVMSAIVFARQEEMRKKDPTLLGGRSEGARVKRRNSFFLPM